MKTKMKNNGKWERCLLTSKQSKRTANANILININTQLKTRKRFFVFNTYFKEIIKKGKSINFNNSPTENIVLFKLFSEGINVGKGPRREDIKETIITFIFPIFETNPNSFSATIKILGI